ncbi:MAG: histidine phosphatase family protein [Clostridia bacterium]|nr:histidine phosphatase family protein [Clostridia bacterium]
MLYFVRHGATDWSEYKNEHGEKDPKFQGRTEVLLNQKGKEQARALAEQLKDIKFDRVICSPLGRAKQTCYLVYKGDVRVEIDERVIERDFGEFEGKTCHEFDFNSFCNRNLQQKYQRAETIQDVEKRVFSLLDELKKKPNQNVLIVSHGGVGCVLMSYFKGIPADGNYLSYILPHGQPLVLDFKELIKQKENDGRTM